MCCSVDSTNCLSLSEGSNFLLYLEGVVGGLDIFLPYIRNYVQTYKNRAITTQMWKDHLLNYFAEKHGGEITSKLDRVDWDVCLFALEPFLNTQCCTRVQAWIYGEGTVRICLRLHCSAHNFA